jgi:hypothetical protein
MRAAAAAVKEPLPPARFRTVTAERVTGHFGLNGERLIVENLESSLEEDLQREEDLMLELEHLRRMRELKAQLVKLAQELVAEDERWYRSKIGGDPVIKEVHLAPSLAIVPPDDDEVPLGV